MSFNSAFIKLIEYNTIDTDEYKLSIRGIVKKLNSIYYNSSSDNSNYICAGSICRGTAITSSDLDFCYILPNEVYKRFSNRKGNIQSQLISEIKNKLCERYPNSEIRGDGQVIDADFKKGLFELVPSFKLNKFSDELVYPDTHNEGSWKKTNPINQKNVIQNFALKYPAYRKICMVIRCWKTQSNVDIKGIEIDTLVMEFFKGKIKYHQKDIENIDIINLLTELFEYLTLDLPRCINVIGEQDYIIIEKSKFEKKSKKAIKKLKEIDSSQLWDNCIELFGSGFPENL